MKFLWDVGVPQTPPSVGNPGRTSIGDPMQLDITRQELSMAAVIPESMALIQVQEAGRQDRSLAAKERERMKGYTATRPLEMQIWG